MPSKHEQNILTAANKRTDHDFRARAQSMNSLQQTTADGRCCSKWSMKTLKKHWKQHSLKYMSPDIWDFVPTVRYWRRLKKLFNNSPCEQFVVYFVRRESIVTNYIEKPVRFQGKKGWKKQPRNLSKPTPLAPWVETRLRVHFRTCSCHDNLLGLSFV